MDDSKDEKDLPIQEDLQNMEQNQAFQNLTRLAIVQELMSQGQHPQGQDDDLAALIRSLENAALDQNQQDFEDPNNPNYIYQGQPLNANGSNNPEYLPDTSNQAVDYLRQMLTGIDSSDLRVFQNRQQHITVQDQQQLQLLQQQRASDWKSMLASALEHQHRPAASAVENVRDDGETKVKAMNQLKKTLVDHLLRPFTLPDCEFTTMLHNLSAVRAPVVPQNQGSLNSEQGAASQPQHKNASNSSKQNAPSPSEPQVVPAKSEQSSSQSDMELRKQATDRLRIELNSYAPEWPGPPTEGLRPNQIAGTEAAVKSSKQDTSIFSTPEYKQAFPTLVEGASNHSDRKARSSAINKKQELKQNKKERIKFKTIDPSQPIAFSDKLKPTRDGSTGQNWQTQNYSTNKGQQVQEKTNTPQQQKKPGPQQKAKKQVRNKANQPRQEQNEVQDGSSQKEQGQHDFDQEQNHRSIDTGDTTINRDAHDQIQQQNEEQLQIENQRRELDSASNYSDQNALTSAINKKQEPKQSKKKSGKKHDP